MSGAATVIPERIKAKPKAHAEVQSIEDEWFGVTDPVIRRKLQNRLNQRAARRRKAAANARQNSNNNSTASTKPQSASGSVSQESTLTSSLNELISLANQSVVTDWNSAVKSSSDKTTQRSAFLSIRRRHSYQAWDEFLTGPKGSEIMARALATRCQRQREGDDNSVFLPPPRDHLICLVHFNVYRAFVSNVALLGLDLNLMYTDDYPSPFLPLSQSANSQIRQLPPTLQPTELQKTIAHHAQWDVIPDPDLRDNILRFGEENIDDVELCLDMVGDGNYDDDPPERSGGGSSDEKKDRDSDAHADADAEPEPETQHRVGFIAWGEPWDINGWEVTRGFAIKWPFLLRNATGIQESTNRWRVRRGEEPLDFERILSQGSISGDK
ncbi:hypothetical protein ABEF95_008123 [Exophiala dermatitidis]